MKVAPEEAWSRFTSASVSTEEPLESFLCIKRTVASLVVQRLEVVPVPGSHGSYYGSYCGIRRDGQALDRNNITKELDYVGVLREITWCTYNRVMEQGKDTAVVC